MTVRTWKTLLHRGPARRDRARYFHDRYVAKLATEGSIPLRDPLRRDFVSYTRRAIYTCTLCKAERTYGFTGEPKTVLIGCEKQCKGRAGGGLVTCPTPHVFARLKYESSV